MRDSLSDRQTRKMENPLLFYFAIILFFTSAVLLVIGLANHGKNKTSEDQEASIEESSISEDDSISKFFDKQKEGGLTEDEEFLINDPFREECEVVSGDDLPSVTSNTVCIR